MPRYACTTSQLAPSPPLPNRFIKTRKECCTLWTTKHQQIRRCKHNNRSLLCNLGSYKLLSVEFRKRKAHEAIDKYFCARIFQEKLKGSQLHVNMLTFLSALIIHTLSTALISSIVL